MKTDFKLIGLGLFLVGLGGAIEAIIEYNDYERLRKHINQFNKRLDAQSEAINATTEVCKYLLKNAKLEEHEE